jgi:hemoglobin
MDDPVRPTDLVEGLRTPLFDPLSMPEELAEPHCTTVWAELRVEAGSVRYTDLDVDAPRDVRLGPGDSATIVPGVDHRIEPSTDAQFFVQFFRRGPSESAPEAFGHDTSDRSGPWIHRGRDLDTPEEVFEMVTRQYVDVGQDDLLHPYFNFGPGFIDWQAHIGIVSDYWCHVLLFAPDYEIDVIEHHRHLHDRVPFTSELFDRWLSIFDETIDGGWSGPNSETAKKRAIGTAWAMAQRFVGHGVWRPLPHRAT